jgi:carbonic anhydrase
MEKLIGGLHKFHQDVFRPQREFFERLARGQQPEALFITCSDSRIAPNVLTQTAPGDLFILRNAGNIVPPHGPSAGGEAATVEYAVSALGVRDIIVCGHSGCGAMSALVQPQNADNMPAVRSWLLHAEATRRILQENYRHLQGDALLDAAVQENVLVQLEHLRTQPAVFAALARGDLHLHGWVYRLNTGEVFAYEPGSQQFVALNASEAQAQHGFRTTLNI